MLDREQGERERKNETCGQSETKKGRRCRKQEKRETERQTDRQTNLKTDLECAKAELLECTTSVVTGQWTELPLVSKWE